MGFALATTLLLSSTIHPSGLFPAEAQSANAAGDQESLLPPEVVPVDPNSAYSSSSMAGAGGFQSGGNVPGLVTNPQETVNSLAAETQSAQDFRKSLMDSLAGKGNYPQFNNQNPYASPSVNQPVNQSANQVPNQGAPVQPEQPVQPQVQPNDPSNGQPFANNAIAPTLGQSDWMNPNQDNSMANAQPPQSQVMSGPVRNNQAPSRGGTGFAHGLGIGTSLGSTVLTGAMMGGPMGAYSLGLSGLTLLNFGLRNGFRF